MESGVDVGIDLGPDAIPDVAIELVPDAIPDVGIDLAPDAIRMLRLTRAGASRPISMRKH